MQVTGKSSITASPRRAAGRHLAAAVRDQPVNKTDLGIRERVELVSLQDQALLALGKGLPYLIRGLQRWRGKAVCNRVYIIEHGRSAAAAVLADAQLHQ